MRAATGLLAVLSEIRTLSEPYTLGIPFQILVIALGIANPALAACFILGIPLRILLLQLGIACCALAAYVILGIPVSDTGLLH